MENKVKAARQHIGMTQKELAEHAKTSTRNIRRIEKGQQPRAQMAALIAGALRKDVGYLFSEAS